MKRMSVFISSAVILVLTAGTLIATGILPFSRKPDVNMPADVEQNDSHQGAPEGDPAAREEEEEPAGDPGLLDQLKKELR